VARPQDPSAPHDIGIVDDKYQVRVIARNHGRECPDRVRIG